MENTFSMQFLYCATFFLPYVRVSSSVTVDTGIPFIEVNHLYRFSLPLYRLYLFPVTGKPFYTGILLYYLYTIYNSGPPFTTFLSVYFYTGKPFFL